jgi:hypothetical protein
MYDQASAGPQYSSSQQSAGISQMYSTASHETVTESSLGADNPYGLAAPSNTAAYGAPNISGVYSPWTPKGSSNNYGLSGLEYSAQTGFGQVHAAEQAYIDVEAGRIGMDRRAGSRINTYTNGLYLSTPVADDHDTVQEQFLIPGRPDTQHIGTTSEMHNWIEEAFEKVTGDTLPTNLQITICSRDELKKRHSGRWSEGIMGFSINRQGLGVNEIVIRENRLDQVMLTIGHEIGHIMSPTLSNPQDEEAKAFAFELAWIQKVIEHKIAGLDSALHMPPARNGLHDVGFGLVQDLVSKGKTAMQAFIGLVKGEHSVFNKLEMIVKAPTERIYIS